MKSLALLQPPLPAVEAQVDSHMLIDTRKQAGKPRTVAA